MLLLWFFLVATLYLNESCAHENGKEKENHRILKLKKISDDEDAEIEDKISNDEIWFDTDDSDEKDYEVLDLEEDSTLYLSEDGNSKSLLNDLKQEENTSPTNSYDDLNKPQNEDGRFKRDIAAEDIDGSFENGRGDLSLPPSIKMDDGYFFSSPKPYTKVYDHEHAGPEKEKGEDRWDISPCVTNLRELYTCIFCSADPSVRQHFISCYGLLPKRVREQSMKCFGDILKVRFGLGSDDMDYYHYMCQKHKSIRKIIKCVAKKLPELPKEEFFEEESTLAKYSYCLYSINSRHCY